MLTFGEMVSAYGNLMVSYGGVRGHHHTKSSCFVYIGRYNTYFVNIKIEIEMDRYSFNRGEAPASGFCLHGLSSFNMDNKIKSIRVIIDGKVELDEYKED